MRRLLTSLICAVAIHATAQTPVAIQVDLSKPVGAYKPIYSWFGYDESNYTTMKYGKQLLTELHDFEGFRTLATNGVDKPVLNVFRMAGLMSGNRVSTSSTGQLSLDQILKEGVRQAPDIGVQSLGPLRC
jgi:hypothetical protein